MRKAFALVPTSLLLFAIVGCAPNAAPTPTPDAKATEQRIAQNIFATLTASAPTLTPTPLSTNTPTPGPASTATDRPTLTPTRYLTPTPTATRTARDISLLSLSGDEERMVKDAINLLKSCAPPMYNYVRTHIDTVTRGNKLRDTNAYVNTNSPIVYLPEDGSINDPIHYTDSMRTFVAAIVLVHEARHLELGRASTEPDAYRFTLPLFDPCKPNDIGAETIQQADPLEIAENVFVGGGTYASFPKSYCPFYVFRSYTIWRASLPYDQEPPESVKPPAVPWSCLF